MKAFVPLLLGPRTCSVDHWLSVKRSSSTVIRHEGNCRIFMYRSVLLSALLAAAIPTLAYAAPTAPVHVRGSIVSVSPHAVVVRTGSQTETISLGQPLRVVGVVRSSLANVAQGDFIGTTVAPQPNGSLQALEVHIFPASLKGTGEGYYPWDLQRSSMMANATVQNVAASHSGSMMANATVKNVASTAGSRTVLLSYKGGTKTVTIPASAPIVALKAGSPAILRPGAHVFVIATSTSSGLVARAINVGENGLVPPM